MITNVEKAYFTIVNKENIGLADSFSVNPISCENPNFYKDYLQFSAIADLYTGRNTTHLFIDKKENRIMGFISLRSSTIFSTDEQKITGSPAMEISVLAVDKDYERRGVGSTLIDYVLTQADTLHDHIMGLQYIILAADKIAVGFYEKLGFERMERQYDQMPKEIWNVNCVPMSMFLDFEKKYIVRFVDEEDDE